MADYLKQKGQTWYVRLAVPPRLRARVGGRSELIRSLRTRDQREAHRRKHSVLADLHGQLERAEVAEVPSEQAQGVRALLEAARDLHAAVQRGETTYEEAQQALDASVDNYLTAARRKYGEDTEGDPKMPEAERRALRRATRVLDTGEVVLLSDAVTKYLAECAQRGLRKQTLREKERTYSAFAKWLGDDPEIAEITRRMAGRYVTEHLMPQGRALKTVKDAIGHQSAFFEWMLGRGEFGLEANPWRGVSKTVRANTRGTRPKRRPWTNDELKRLLEGIKATDPLWPMVAIAAYTGMRREEIANLRTADVAADHLSVTEGKTKAAVRPVPLHPVIADLVARLREQSRDGFLIPGLLRGGADGKRGHYVGKRFGTVKERLGFDDASLNFHTLRNAFIQRCEEAEVPEWTVKLLVGHSRQSQTFGGYSPGSTFDSLAKAVARVTFGPVDALVKERAETVQVRASQGRRGQRARRAK